MSIAKTPSLGTYLIHQAILIDDETTWFTSTITSSLTHTTSSCLLPTPSSIPRLYRRYDSPSQPTSQPAYQSASHVVPYILWSDTSD